MRHESVELQRHRPTVDHLRASLIATVLVLSREGLCQTAGTTAVRPPITSRSSPTPLSGSTDAARGASIFQAPPGGRDERAVSSHGGGRRQWQAPASAGSLRGSRRGWGCPGVGSVVKTATHLHGSWMRRIRQCLGGCRVLRAPFIAAHASLELTGACRGCSLVPVRQCGVRLCGPYDGARRDVGSPKGRSVVRPWVRAPRRAQRNGDGGGVVVVRWCLRGGRGEGATIASRRLRTGDA